MTHPIRPRHMIDSTRPTHQRSPVQRLMRLVLATAIPAGWLTYPLLGYAIPQSAVITDLQPQSGSNVPSVRLGLTSTAAPARLNQFIDLQFEHSIPRQALIVSGRSNSQAYVRFDRPADPILQIGPGSTTTEYLFPCEIRGQGLIGWRAMPRNQSGCVAMTLGASGSSGVVGNFDLLNDAPLLATKSLQAQLDATDFQYCGALEETGTGWGFSYTTDSNTNPCRQAIADCESTGSGGTCAIATVGREPIATPELIASAQCPGILGLTTEGSGQAMLTSELTVLQNMARALRGKSCLITLYQPGELIITRATDELTLVEVETTASGEVAVLTLVGEVDVVSADRPRGMTLPEGFRYQAGQSSVEPLNCPALFDSEPMQSFFNPAHWGQESGVADQLAGYQAEFCENTPESPDVNSPGPGIDFPFPILFPNDDLDNTDGEDNTPPFDPTRGPAGGSGPVN